MLRNAAERRRIIAYGKARVAADAIGMRDQYLYYIELKVAHHAICRTYGYRRGFSSGNRRRRSRAIAGVTSESGINRQLGVTEGVMTPLRSTNFSR